MYKIPYGIDVSKWQPFLTEESWALLSRVYGVSFAFIKASQGYRSGVGAYIDPLFKTHWANSKKYLPRGPYHFYVPDTSSTNPSTYLQIEDYLSIIGGRNHDIQIRPVVDHELRTVAGPKLIGQLHDSLLHIEAVTRLRPLIYTAKDVWDNTVYDLKYSRWRVIPSWVKDYDLWIASYLRSIPKTLPKDWSDFSLSPTLPNAWVIIKHKFWQYTDKGKFTNFPRKSFDINVFNGDESQLRRYLTNVTTPPPPPDRTQPTKKRAKVITAELRIRSGPGTDFRFIGGLLRDHIVTVEEEITHKNGDIWVRIGDNRWAAMKYQGTLLMNYV